MEKEIRVDRIFPLKDASFYPGKEFCDIVYFCPPITGKKRLWLLTEAKKPIVYIDHYKFEPRNISKKDKYRWIDYGITEVELAMSRGFGQIKVYGVNPEQAINSYFVITVQTNKKLSGSIESVEKKLFGITREDTGRSFISPSTVEVGRPVTFKLIYQAGKNGLPEKSYIRFSISRVFTQPQTENSRHDGFLRVVQSDAELIFKGIKGPSDESHRDADIIYFLPDGIRANGKIEIEYHTDTTFICPVTSHTMERRYWYSNMPSLSPAVALDKKKIFVPVSENNGQCVRFVAGKPERLFLFFPGRIREKETIDLVGIITDRYRNIVEDKNWKVKINILLEGSQKKEIKNISEHLTHRHRFCIDFHNLVPGIYRAKAFDQDTGKLLAISNPVEIMDASDNRDQIFWGEIHGHTEMSDGIGAFENLYENAKNTGCLDFAAAADHACYFTDNQWEWMQDVTNSFNKPGRFCTIVGYEWAGNQGHRNIYTSENRLKLFRGMYKPAQDIEVVYKTFEGNPSVVAGPHTGHTGDFWKFHNPDVERFLEIYSMWGHFDHLANKLLNEGAIIGFTGGGDCHSGNVFFSPEDPDGQGKTPHFTSYAIKYKCGIMAAFMKTLDRKNLIDALRNRRTYATTSDRILVDFSISGYKMGEMGTDGNIVITADIHGCDIIKKIEVVRNGTVVHVEKPESMDTMFQWKDSNIERKKYWYYLKITQKNREVAYTGPIWIEVI
ncbi:MAG TPA: CehA/McbA family metallohydrolase [bacterium]|nr:CehA/McbA family metallohydrolase [bacterium]HPO52485.1 CehA/McbA family metallohydrolase [bacterium]